MIVRFLAGCLSVAAGCVSVAFCVASIDPPVYAPPRFYEITRFVDVDGTEKVRIAASVTKRLSCDLESGSGPVWVDFYAAPPVPTTPWERLRSILSFDLSRDPVPPSSAMFRPSGEVAGETELQAGESMQIRGYTASVPPKLEGVSGEFNVRVPCQLWEPNGDGTKEWGRQVVATFGPLPLPMPSRTIRDYVDLTRRD